MWPGGMRRVTQDGQTCGGKTQNPNRATRHLNFRKGSSPQVAECTSNPPRSPQGQMLLPYPHSDLQPPHHPRDSHTGSRSGLLWQLGGTTEWGMTGNGVIAGCVEFKLESVSTPRPPPSLSRTHVRSHTQHGRGTSAFLRLPRTPAVPRGAAGATHRLQVMCLPAFSGG
jgi:hypothetical protein